MTAAKASPKSVPAGKKAPVRRLAAKKAPAKRPTLKLAPEPPGPTAPEHLEKSTREWWDQVVTDFELESHHVRLLTKAAEAWDRAEQARAQLADEGITYVDRFGAPRKHPAVAIEETARLHFARMLRELDLDAEALPPPRPPRRGRR